MSQNSLFKIGDTPIESILKIVKRNRNISHIYIATYKPKRSKEDKKLSRISRHSSVGRIIEIPRKEIEVDILENIINSTDKNSQVALLSKVKLKNQNSIFHLPLMDFNCRVSSKNLANIKKFMKEIKQKDGLIFDSGASYHYYGSKPFSQKDWYDFLGKCILFDYSDKHYIGHQLIEGYNILRISKFKEYSSTPKVVSVL